MREAVGILRTIALDGEIGTKDPFVRKIAEDDGAVGWLADYWNFVMWNEHGNEPSLSEIGFSGLADVFRDPEYAYGYIIGEDPDDVLPAQAELWKNFAATAGRLGIALGQLGSGR